MNSRYGSVSNFPSSYNGSASLLSLDSNTQISLRAILPRRRAKSELHRMRTVDDEVGDGTSNPTHISSNMTDHSADIASNGRSRPEEDTIGGLLSR